MKSSLQTGVLLLLIGSSVIPAGAQSVDYTEAEQLFGEPVTTSATGKPQRASEVPAEMTTVTADDIRRSGANNIPDVLQFVPELDVRRYGMADASVGIRGYNTALNPRVLVLLDGRQVYEDDYGMTVWSLIPVTISEIRQIEIIKGPNAALYGFNAVSGVINIITYDPLRDNINAVRLDGGTQNQAYGEATATVRLPGRLGMRLSAQGFRSTEFPGNQGEAAREQPHTGNLGLDTRVQLAPGVEWDVSGSIGSVDGDYYVDTGLYNTTSFRANSVRSRLAADTSLGVLTLDAYRNENRTADTSPAYATNWREDVTVVQASDLLKFGSHTLRFAAEYRDNTLASLQSFDGRIGYTDVAGSVMWDWQILPQLTLTSALRIDDLSLKHQGAQFNIPSVGGLFHAADIIEPSFNSGAVLKLTDYDTIRATAARAVQLPSLLDFGIARNFAFAILAGNPGLQPATVTNYELDYDRSLPWLDSTVRIAAFAQHTNMSIGSPFGSGYSLLPSGQVLVSDRNFGSSDELGGEIGIKGSNAAGLRWNLSYALAAVRDDSPRAELLVAPSVSYQRQTPTSSVILGGGYTWQHLEFDAQARWQSHFEDYTFNPRAFIATPIVVPNYITLNARVGYQINDHVTLSVVAEQLNQHSIAESAGLQVNRRFFASVKAQF